MKSSFTRDNGPLVGWAVLLLAAIVVATARISGEDDWIRSNVFELLPAADYDPLVEAATRTVDAELGTRLLFFLGHADRSVAKQSAESLGSMLETNGLVASVTTRVDESQARAMGEFYYGYRTRILSDEQIKRIEESPETVESEALAQLYNPFGPGAAGLASDPFFLFPGSLEAMQPAGNALQLDDGFLWGSRDGIDYVFVMANLVSATLSIGDQEALAREINAALDNLRQASPGLDVLKTGFSFYAHQATESAKGEVSTIGVGSLIGLLLLVISTFRSLRPLGLIVISILSGCIIALAVTLTAFGFVHLFTLVFGASLIGVSVDYAFHYIADDAFGGDDWTPRAGLRNIFAGITLGLATSILAYLALTVAPFPGLQQLAVFSSAGLIGAYLTLLAATRVIRRRYVLQRRSIVLLFAKLNLDAWRRFGKSQRAAIAIVIALVVIAGGRMIAINDDVRMLQSQPPELVRQEAAIQELLGLAQAGTFVLVSASSDEELLLQEESIREQLDGLIGAGSLDSYQAMSQWVPSAERQQRSQNAWNTLMESRLPGFLASAGVETGASRDIVEQAAAETPVLDVATWLDHPASESFRRLWIETDDDTKASIILLFGVRDLADLAELDVINKGRELSTLFGEYRDRVVQMLAVAYLVILLGLSTRYGFRRAALVVSPPIMAGLLTLALISLAGGTLNLFNFLALILVLGIGIDFTLFIAEAKHELTSTVFAITLSALTTMLSFGLLALSSTFAVHSFGMTVLIGIAFAYLLAPFATAVQSEPESP